MAFKSPRIVVASAARVSSGNSGAISLADIGEDLHLQVIVTAVSGTPNMVLTVTWSHDGTNFSALDGGAEAFAAITTATSTVKNFPVRGPFYQINWVISGGTPSLTFTVTDFVST